MRRSKQSLIALGLAAGVAASGASGASALTMSAANLENMMGARFMVTRVDLAKNTMTVVLRDSTVERVSMALILGHDNTTEGVADRAAFTGSIAEDDISAWGYKAFDVPASSLPLNTEVEVEMNEGVDLSTGEWGVGYYSLGDYVGKISFSDCQIEFENGDWAEGRPYRPGEFECRITSPGPMTWPLGTENGDYMSPATEAALGWKFWSIDSVLIQYCYLGQKANEGVAMALPDDIRTLEMVAEGTYPSGWGRKVGVWEKPGEMGWKKAADNGGGTGAGSGGAGVDVGGGAGVNGDANGSEERILVLNLQSGGGGGVKSGLLASAEGSESPAEAKNVNGIEKSEKALGEGAEGLGEVVVPGLAEEGAGKKLLPWLLIPIAMVAGFLLAWWVLPGKKSEKDVQNA